MTMQNTLDSLFLTTSYKNFHKLDEPSCLQQFHARFWGRRIEDSAQSWLDSLSADDRDELELQGPPSLWGNENRMDVDDDDNSANPPVEEDDLREGCHVLDLDLGLSQSKVWVRADYIRIYDACEKMFLGRTKNRILVTGQPGIGKTVWLLYAARRRAGEGKPFILDQAGTPFLFVEEGVFQISQEPVSPWQTLRQGLLVFVDADTGSVKKYTGHLAPMCVVFTSSPNPDQWKSFFKTGRHETLIMEPWARREIRRCARLDLFRGVSETQAMDIVQRLGPIPRLILDQRIYDQLPALKYDIDQLSATDIKKLISNASLLSMDEISEQIVLLGRREHNNVAGLSKVSIISDRVSTALALRFRVLEKSQQVNLYKELSLSPLASQAAGFIYEANIMKQLSEGLRLCLVPIIKPASSNRRPHSRRPQWQTPHNRHLDSTLEPLRSVALEAQEQLILSQAEIEEFTNIPEQPISHNTLYIPTLSNRTAHDAFFVLGDVIYFFRVTIAASHNINEKLVDFAENLGFEAKNRRFIFITPTKSCLSVPCPRNPALRDMAVFVVALDLSV